MTLILHSTLYGRDFFVVVLFCIISFLLFTFRLTLLFRPVDHLSKQLWCMLTVQKQKKIVQMYRNLSANISWLNWNWTESTSDRERSVAWPKCSNANQKARVPENEQEESVSGAKGNGRESNDWVRKKSASVFWRCCLICCVWTGFNTSAVLRVLCCAPFVLRLILSSAPFNLSFSRFIYSFWFVLFCSSLPSEHGVVCLDDQSCGISRTQTSMQQPYQTRVNVCVMYFCILLTRYFAESIETWQKYTNESGEPRIGEVTWMCMSVRCSAYSLQFFHCIDRLNIFPTYSSNWIARQTKQMYNVVQNPQIYFRLSLTCV